LVKISRNSMVLRRIKKFRRTIDVNTQKLRGKALESLNDLFDLAQANARNENLSLKQRQIWVRTAAYIAQIINSVASGFDERQINAYLDELERLVSEARAKAKVRKNKEGSAGIKGRDQASP